MSQLERLHEERDSRKNGKKGDIVQKGSFFSFHPTVQHKDALKLRKDNVEADIRAINRIVDRGYKFTLAYLGKNNTYAASVREETKDWQKAINATAFHSDALKAIKGLAFYLTEVNPDFPAGHSAMESFTDEW